MQEYASSDHLNEIFNTHRQMTSRLIQQSYGSPGAAQSILTEHSAIMDALQNGKEPEILTAIEAHLNHTRDTALEMLHKTRPQN